jgi:GDPmannose 4,6-dehydratase
LTANSEKIALITGITGQDGSYLARFLLHKQGYHRVVGLVRRTSDDEPEQRLRLPTLRDYLQTGRLVLATGDVLDLHSLVTVLEQYGPDEIYNLAAQSHVGKSFDLPEMTIATSINGVLNILKAVAMTDFDVRIYQASTSEMFGDAAKSVTPQDECTPFLPVSPYGAGKAAAHRLMVMARSRRDIPLWACSGILFNHESPHRGLRFVSRKITLAVAQWLCGTRGVVLRLGHLDAQRDWGYAGDYVRAMWQILNQPVKNPYHLRDYLVATGETHSVRDFVTEAFKAAGRLSGKGEPSLKWEGELKKEHLVVNGEVCVAVDPALYRPNELPALQGNPRLIKQDLGWEPTITFNQMVRMMVAHDVAALSAGVR